MKRTFSENVIANNRYVCLYNEEISLHLTLNHIFTSTHINEHRCIGYDGKLFVVRKESDDFLFDYFGVLSIFSSVDLLDSTYLFNTSDQKENQSSFWYVEKLNKSEEIVFLLLAEVSTTDDDKRCYACKDADEECVTPCTWTQRCYLKARHANATSLFLFHWMSDDDDRKNFVISY